MYWSILSVIKIFSETLCVPVKNTLIPELKSKLFLMWNVFLVKCILTNKIKTMLQSRKRTFAICEEILFATPHNDFVIWCLCFGCFLLFRSQLYYLFRFRTHLSFNVYSYMNYITIIRSVKSKYDLIDKLSFKHNHCSLYATGCGSYNGTCPKSY